MSADPHLVALLGLSKLGPFRLRALLDVFDEPGRAWDAVRYGRLDQVPLRSNGTNRVDLVAGWRSEAAEVAVDEIIPMHRAAGVGILDPSQEAWPEAFVHDPEPPPIVFFRGDPDLLGSLSVAIVGTRRCTASGTATARDLGAGLAIAGVSVVSGLALGIDGAAHRGALDAEGPVLGVVATGLDVVYPRRHAALWEDVSRAGVVISEAPLGTKAERWRFPARNRLIAALARIVVVVESRRSGGSMLTVESAIARQVDVLAVPGPVRSPVSAGPNQLLADGCGVARDSADVLAALGVRVPSAGAVAAPGSPPGGDDDEGGELDPVLCAVTWPSSSLDEIVGATGLRFSQVAARLASLEAAGVVERADDGYRRVAG
ncbi:MAG: DNA-processing protein DprA [Acidimicrobiales bacterium]|nr:DNA-processing protein DprA [Acidimicrobiales bacterium]